MIADDNSFRRKKREPSAAEVLQREPPFDLEAEMGVLGSILLMPEISDEIASLRADDFYSDANRKIYHQLREMHDGGDKIDVTLLVSRLRTGGDYETVGGAAYLARLAGAVPNAAHAMYYADIVSEKAVYRRLIESSTEILRDAYEQNSTAKELWRKRNKKSLRSWTVVRPATSRSSATCCTWRWTAWKLACATNTSTAERKRDCRSSTR